MRTKYDTTRLNQIEFSLVAEKYGRVKRVGANLYAECPWHDDKHPSLLIGGRKGNFCHCFSCGKSGSVIDYVMAVRRCDFKEACEVLHHDFNIETLSSLPVKGGSVVRKGKRTASPLHKVEGWKRGCNLIDSEVGKLRRKREWERKEEFCYIPMEYLEEHVGGENSFFNCIRTIFTEEGVQWLIDEYKLGTWPLQENAVRMASPLGGRGAVMFPSIDINGRVHNIKIQRYCDDVGSERFFHKEDKSTFWLGSILAKRHPELFSQSSHPDGLPPWGSGGLHFDSTCFFGEHLLPKYPDLPVVLVESPKNAIIGTGAVTTMLWIAVGNKNNLTRGRLECLRGRKVIVIPDNDAVEEWRAILAKMGDIATFCFSSFCDTVLKEQGKKGDVADYVIEKLKVNC